MRLRNPFAQIVVMVIAASAIAVVANGFAGRTRKLVLPGYYPNALKVPVRVAETPSPVPGAVRASGAPPVPSPVVPSPAETTTTIAPVTATVSTDTVTATLAPPPKGAPEVRTAPVPPTPAPAVDVSKFQPHPDKAYVELGGDDVAALFRAGALFLDARRTSVYETGHIAGARSFSVWESDIDDKVSALYSERSDPADQNKPIVIYCSGGACEDSHMLSQKLWGIQFNNVYVYKDGYPDWQQRGLPTKTGAQP